MKSLLTKIRRKGDRYKSKTTGLYYTYVSETEYGIFLSRHRDFIEAYPQSFNIYFELTK